MQWCVAPPARSSARSLGHLAKNTAAINGWQNGITCPVCLQAARAQHQGQIQPYRISDALPNLCIVRPYPSRSFALQSMFSCCKMSTLRSFLGPRKPSGPSSRPGSTRSSNNVPSNQDAPDALETARNLVRDSIINVSQCNYLKESFVPCNEIEKLVTREFVEPILVKLKIGNHERLVEFIVGDPGAKRLFLVLGRAGKFDLLGTLYDNHFDDRVLPVGFRINDLGTTEGYTLSIDHGPGYPFFDDWDENDRVLLEAKQWDFLAPKFGEGAFQISLQKAHRLPYRKRRAKPSGDGFFGEVYHAEILKAHLAQGLWPTVSRDSHSHLRFLNAYMTRLRKRTPSRLPSRKPRITKSSPASLIERQIISDKSGRSIAHLTSSSPLQHTAMATKDA